MSHTPVKKYPDPDRPEIKFPDPDRPEIKFPDPTRPGNKQVDFLVELTNKGMNLVDGSRV